MNDLIIKREDVTHLKDILNYVDYVTINGQKLTVSHIAHYLLDKYPDLKVKDI